MATKDYLYSGPPSGRTLPDGREVQLHPGTTVGLPEDAPWVRNLLERQLLTPIPEAKPRSNRPAKEGGDA